MKHFKTIFFTILISLSLSGCRGPEGPQGVSIVSIQLTSSEGNVDTYTITYSNETTSTFNVTNGESVKGDPGEDGHTPVVTIGDNGNWFVDGVDSGIKAQGDKGEPGKDGTSMLTGNGEPSTSLGKNGDSYINLDNWDYFVKEDGAWVKKGNIKGENGSYQTGKSAYELYVEQYPGYTWGQEQWIKDLATGKLYVEINFNSNGGSTIESINACKGEEITINQESKKYGSILLGWYLDEDFSKKTETTFIAEESIDLYAKWKEITPVYVIMGQSNASGNSLYPFLETKDPEIYSKFYGEGVSNVQYAYDNFATKDENFQNTKFGLGDYFHGEGLGFGPEIGVADVLSKYEQITYVIKAACSGTALSGQWFDYDGNRNDLYNQMVGFIKDRIDYLENSDLEPVLCGIFWMQGESDSQNYWTASMYKDREIRFINYLYEDLEGYYYEHFNFVDAFISTECYYWINASVVNQAKYEISQSTEHCYCIKTNGEDETALSLKSKADSGEEDDSAHYDSVSMVALGREAAKHMI